MGSPEDMGVPCGTGSRASHGATKASPPEASIPNAVTGHWHTPEGQEKAQEYAAIDRERLACADVSDFELANRVYLAGRNDLDLIHWQTAAKERIRWLSVQLVVARAQLAAAEGGAK